MNDTPVVLVVDDNEDMLSLYEVLLTEAGYRVTGAADGHAGLDLAESLHPDVIVLDMMMPDMDGLAFLERLPSHANPAPPVIVCSGFAEFEPHARERGARAFLRKPVAPDELLAALERTLAGREEPVSTRDQAARVAAEREQAAQARDKILGNVDLDSPELRATLEGVLAWQSRYHGFGRGFVDLLMGDRFYFAAGHVEEQRIARELVYCSNVVDAGSSLMIHDTAAHPVFAEHPARAHWGTRFYAGSPIVTGEGSVLGVLCLIDTVPHCFSVSSMRVLEHLARCMGEHFGALAEGRRPPPFFEPPALVECPAFELIADDQLATATDVVLLSLAPTAPGALAGVARRLAESARLPRFTATRWTADTLAFACDGAHPRGAIERAIAELRAAGSRITAVGVAEWRPKPGQGTSASTVLASAERARARSAAEEGTIIHAPVTGARGAD